MYILFFFFFYFYICYFFVFFFLDFFFFFFFFFFFQAEDGIRDTSVTGVQTCALPISVSFIGRFEEAIVRYAKKFSVDAVLCGHIHSAAIRQFDGVTYYNCGDWVESCSALIEREDGAPKW